MHILNYYLAIHTEFSLKPRTQSPISWQAKAAQSKTRLQTKLHSCKSIIAVSFFADPVLIKTRK